MTITNPWDVPPILPTGDMERKDIHLAVGMALDAWEGVEQAFADIFVAFVGGFQEWPSPHPAIRAYGSVVSFKGRSDMVSAAGEGFFHNRNEPQLKTHLNKILKDAARFSARRNEIAHGRVYPRDDDNNRWLGHYLQPGLFASGKRPTSGDVKYAYVSAQIHEIRKHFSSFEDQVRDVENRICDLPELP
ncbi:hypothetical protein [Bosea sp. BH3]|uniref:hypothetical protein n=1 Tax=Bosea sp. BH3 TaxID=2871701 RepID=UPI0021CB453F|nr:hypothetical protein [Bosea sp. BH3]MCU4180216.1 hypothetical protein [Bosea sp. BH3]